MRAIDAFWEKRNLGVTCTEVVLEESDTADSVHDQLRSLTTQYQVVKVPVARYDLMKAVEEAGFSFIEASLNVVHHLNGPEPSGIMKRIDESVSYQEMETADVERLHQEIRQGLFKTDRIYLDNVFEQRKAAERYLYWIEDEVNRGAQLYKLAYRGESIGFFIFKETDNGGCYPFLAGLYPTSTAPGMGNVLIHKLVVEARKRGRKFISSYISTNNAPVVKVHLSEGFAIAQISYVYIKHQAQ